jgi:hypothetical protein
MRVQVCIVCIVCIVCVRACVRACAYICVSVSVSVIVCGRWVGGRGCAWILKIRVCICKIRKSFRLWRSVGDERQRQVSEVDGDVVVVGR